jgi:hypothetical protein
MTNKKFLVTLEIDVTDEYNELASTGIEGFELERQLWKINAEKFEGNELFNLVSQGNVRNKPIFDGDGKQMETERYIKLGIQNTEKLNKLSIELWGNKL